MITAPCAPRVRFRDITADDAYLVCRWRNTPSARAVFYSQDVVTPDTHRAFLARRRPHDLIWIVERMAPVSFGAATGMDVLPHLKRPEPIGMLSLTVDTIDRTGEYGRAYLDDAHRGQGYWREIESLLEHFAFVTLGLQSLWLDIIADNQRMIDIHLAGGWQVTGDAPDARGTRPPGIIMALTAEQYRQREDGAAGPPADSPAKLVTIERREVFLGEVADPLAGYGIAARMQQAQSAAEREGW